MVIHCLFYYGLLGLRSISVKALGKKYLHVLAQERIWHSGYDHFRSDEASNGVDLFPDKAVEIDWHPSNPSSKWMQIIIDCGRMCALQIKMVISSLYLHI